MAVHLISFQMRLYLSNYMCALIILSTLQIRIMYLFLVFCSFLSFFPHSSLIIPIHPMMNRISSSFSPPLLVFLLMVHLLLLTFLMWHCTFLNLSHLLDLLQMLRKTTSMKILTVIAFLEKNHIQCISLFKTDFFILLSMQEAFNFV